MVSLISLSDISLLVSRSAIDFCVLTLYPVTFPYSLMSSSSNLVVSLGISSYRIRSLQTVIVLLLFQFGSLFFPSLMAMAKISKIILNNICERGYPCLVPNLSGNAFRFLPLRVMLAVGLP